MQITSHNATETLKALGEERSRAVNELFYSRQISSIGDKAEAALASHIERITLSYAKLLDQVDQYEVCDW